MIEMPWTDSTAPNFILDVTDACNARCRWCYAQAGSTFKSLGQILRDLDDGLALRPAHTVTLSGGEPSLHPQLPEIIRRVSERDLHTFLLTNGVTANHESMLSWKRSGLGSVLFHVQAGQHRPDLPQGATAADFDRRLRELVDTADRVGLDISISATLDDHDPETLEWITRLAIEDPRVGFLFIARGTDVNDLPSHGDAFVSESLCYVQNHFEHRFGVLPFAYIPSTGARNTCWVSFFVPVAYSRSGHRVFRYRANRADLWLIKLHRALTGRYTHKLTQRRALTAIRTLVNGLTTWRPLATASFLWDFLVAAEHAGHTMVVYDDGPSIQSDGSVDRCEYCPTALVRHGSLHPCCVVEGEIQQ
jgi:hypothetical protein